MTNETHLIGYSLEHAVSSFDLFPDKFRFAVQKGSPKFKTVMGGAMTLIMVILIFIFGLIRIITVFNGDRTTITDFVDHNTFGKDFTFDGEGTDFAIAFGLTSMPISNPVDLNPYGDYFATYTEFTGGKRVDIPVKFRPCTEGDFGFRDAQYRKFYDIEKSERENLKLLIPHLQCLENPVRLSGGQFQPQSLNLGFKQCTVKSKSLCKLLPADL